MRRRFRLGRWWLLAVPLLVIAAAVAVPYVGADGFATPIRQGLEASLGRKVDFNGKVRFQLLPRPGFTVEDVTIHELPALGVEPIAYVTSLEIAPAVSSLWERRIVLAGIRLVEPSINLMKAPSGTWNVKLLLEQVTRGPAAQVSSLPEIEVTGGRLNFKFGDLKSIYYLADTDLAIEAGSDSRLSLQFSGEPARTDRPSRAFGRLSGRGSFLAGSSAEASRIELNLALERTAIAEVLTLFQGRSVGLSGFLTSRARLAGPLTNIEIEGRLELDQFERWRWLLSGESARGVNFQGVLDAQQQSLRLETRSSRPEEAFPIAARIRATDLLGDTRWASTLIFRGLPLDSLRSLAKETGSDFPTALPLEGLLTGAVGYSPSSGFRGQVDIGEATLNLPGAPPLAFKGLAIIADGPKLHARSASIRVGDKDTARIDADYQLGSPNLEVRLESPGIQLAHLQAAWPGFTGVQLPLLLANPRGGSIKGILHYVRKEEDEQQPEAWNGKVALTGTEMTVAGMAQPVAVESAELVLQSRESTLRVTEGRLGELPFTAEYTLPAGARTARLNLRFPVLSSSIVEASLAPALRRNQGFLARTLRLSPAALPEWLRDRRLAVTVEIGAFDIGGIGLENLRAGVRWTGSQIDLRDFSASLGAATLAGGFTVSLDGPLPVYRGHVNLAEYPWREGRIDADAALDSTGTGLQWLANLNLNGSFQARDLTLSPDVESRSMTGCFTFTAGAGTPRLQLTGVSAVIGAESYLGQSTPGSDGRLSLELASPQRTLRMSGKVTGFQLDLAMAR